MLTEPQCTRVHKYHHLGLCLAGNLSLIVFLPMMFLILYHIKKLQAKLAKFQSIVDTNIVQAASLGYNYGSRIRTCGVNDPVWLLIPHQEKLGSKWQGGWTVKALRGTVTLK